jgi:hypothetical protein
MSYYYHAPYHIARTLSTRRAHSLNAAMVAMDEVGAGYGILHVLSTRRAHSINAAMVTMDEVGQARASRGDYRG